MTGRILAALILLCALGAGGAMYYLQVYAFYEEVAPTGDDVALTPLDGGAPRPIPISDFRAIDADSSPIRYRACFSTDQAPDALAESYARYEGAAPRVAPGWFDCFDAEEIGAAIAEGRAQVFVGTRNLEFGIDRVVAITEDGRGYVWHEVNECGDKAYDGSPLGENCPDRSPDA